MTLEESVELLDSEKLALKPRRRWELFLEFRERLERLAFYLLGNAEDAQDLVQDTGLRILKHPTGPRDEASFEAWAKGIVRNAVADYRRAAGRRPVELVGLSIEEYGAEAYGERLTPVDPILVVERRTKLDKQLSSLDLASYQVLVRRYVLGQTATEIANDLQSSPAGVRMKLKRLRSKLKRLLPNLGPLVSTLACDLNAFAEALFA
ncbi:MAG TPA: sigma-70 family RNA polymerase sigma factor [Polyangiaceae bacterium]